MSAHSLARSECLVHHGAVRCPQSSRGKSPARKYGKQMGLMGWDVVDLLPVLTAAAGDDAVRCALRDLRHPCLRATCVFVRAGLLLVANVGRRRLPDDVRPGFSRSLYGRPLHPLPPRALARISESVRRETPRFSMFCPSVGCSNHRYLFQLLLAKHKLCCAVFAVAAHCMIERTLRRSK